MKKETLEFNPLVNFFERLSQGHLPDMSEEEQTRLYEAMSEEDVVRYYQIVDSLGNEERKIILEKWIPKPKALYHASYSGGIESFKPLDKRKRSVNDPPLIFASPLKSVSLIFLLEHSNHDISGSYDGGKTWVLVSESLDDLKKRDRAGYVYYLPPDNFTADSNIGLGLYEWVSEKKVRPSGKEKHNSAVETMLKLGVKIYVPSEDVSMEEFRRGDQATLLDKMRPITLEDF